MDAIEATLLSLIMFATTLQMLTEPHRSASITWQQPEPAFEPACTYGELDIGCVLKAAG